MFGANAGSVYASQYPGVKAGQDMQAQSAGIQAGAQQQQANNTLEVGNYNASMEALQAKQKISNVAEGYNAGGVLPEGTPMGVLEQARQLSVLGINQTLSQSSLEAQFENTKANQTINASRAALLGISNQYTQGLANADITAENVLPRDLGALLGPFGGALLGQTGQAAGSALAGGVQGLFGGGGGSSLISEGAASAGDAISGITDILGAL